MVKLIILIMLIATPIMAQGPLTLTDIPVGNLKVSLNHKDETNSKTKIGWDITKDIRIYSNLNKVKDIKSKDYGLDYFNNILRFSGLVKNNHDKIYSLNLKPTEDFDIGYYYYDGKIDQTKYSLSYLHKDSKITFLTSEIGNKTSQRLTVDNKLFWNLVFSGIQETQDNTITTTHLQSDQKQPINFTVDTYKKDDLESTNTYKVNAVVADFATSIKVSDISKKDIDDQQNHDVDIAWKPTKTLDVKLGMYNREGGTVGIEKSRAYSIKGMISPKLLFLDNLTIDSKLNEREVKGKENLYNSAIKLQATTFNHIITYDNNQQLNPVNNIYYNSEIIKLETDSKKPYKLVWITQDLESPTGQETKKTFYQFKSGIATIEREESYDKETLNLQLQGKINKSSSYTCYYQRADKLKSYSNTYRFIISNTHLSLTLQQITNFSENYPIFNLAYNIKF